MEATLTMILGVLAFITATLVLAVFVLARIADRLDDLHDKAIGRNVLLNNLVLIARNGRTMDDWADADRRQTADATRRDEVEVFDRIVKGKRE